MNRMCFRYISTLHVNWYLFKKKNIEVTLDKAVAIIKDA